MLGVSDVERIVGIHNVDVVVVVVDVINWGREGVIVLAVGDGDGEEARGGGVGTARHGGVHDQEAAVTAITNQDLEMASCAT